MEHRLLSQMAEWIISLIHSWQEGERRICHFDTISLKSSWNSSYMNWAIVTYDLPRESLFTGLITFTLSSSSHRILRTILDTFHTWRYSTVVKMVLITHSPISIWKAPEYFFDVLKRAGMTRYHTLALSDHLVCTNCYGVISHTQRCKIVSFACFCYSTIIICGGYYTGCNDDCHFYHSHW